MAQESHVAEAPFFGQGAALPDPGAFDVHPHKVLVGKQVGHTNGIFPPAAAYFHYQVMVIAKEGISPVPFYRIE